MYNVFYFCTNWRHFISLKSQRRLNKNSGNRYINIILKIIYLFVLENQNLKRGNISIIFRLINISTYPRMPKNIVQKLIFLLFFDRILLVFIKLILSWSTNSVIEGEKKQEFFSILCKLSKKKNKWEKQKILSCINSIFFFFVTNYGNGTYYNFHYFRNPTFKIDFNFFIYLHVENKVIKIINVPNQNYTYNGKNNFDWQQIGPTRLTFF